MLDMMNATDKQTGAEKMTKTQTKEQADLIAAEKRIMDAAEQCRRKWAGIVPMDDNR